MFSTGIVGMQHAAPDERSSELPVQLTSSEMVECLPADFMYNS